MSVTTTSDSSIPTRAQQAASVLQIQDMHKSFTMGSQSIEVLKGVNLEIRQGEQVAICGPSGSGKSTLLSLLSGLDQPTTGTVEVMGQNLGGLNQAELTTFRAKQLGIVFQQFHLLTNLTAWENVMLPVEILQGEKPEERAKKALEQVGLGHRLDHFPYQLSGGECQRVAIARAIVVEPALLLADEPSGNLDTETGDQVMGLLFDLISSQNKTLILVTHNNELAAKCDRRLDLKGGTLVSGN